MPDNQLDPLSSRHVAFSWVSHQPGYRWARGRKVTGGPFDYGNSASENERRRLDLQEETWLVTLPVQGFPRHSIEEHPGLFLEFLALKTTQRSMLDFANKHGTLGFRHRSVEVEGWTGTTSGEPLWQWKRSLLWMQQARDLWALADDGGDAELKKMIRLEEDPYPSLDLWSATYDRRISGQRFHIYVTIGAKNSLANAARFIVQEIVNLHLEDSTAYAQLYNPRTRGFESHVRPKSLLGALWVQFSESLNPGRSYPTCPGCGQRFGVSPDTKRKDSRYCHTRCRVRAYEARKRKARELYHEGLPIREIASRVGSKLKTVHGWVR